MPIALFLLWQIFAPYVPTPEPVVTRMLQLGELKPGEHFFDLGSGDGRLVIQAAKRFQADATGLELDDKLCTESRRRLQQMKLARPARILCQDVLNGDYRDADLVTVYLFPAANEKLRPILEEQLKKGSRVIAHDFPIPGWTPAQVVDLENGGDHRSHTLYLYRR